MGREWKGHRLLIDCKYNKATKSPSATKSYALLDLLILALSTGDATPLLDLALLNELDVGDAIPSLTILLDFALDNNVSIVGDVVPSLADLALVSSVLLEDLPNV